LRNVAARGATDESLDDSSEGEPLAPEALVGVVETALAGALRLAAAAERWELVEQLTHELAARRRRRDPSGEASTPGSPPARRDSDPMLVFDGDSDDGSVRASDRRDPKSRNRSSRVSSASRRR
jgi:hypothetical protein